MGLPQPTSNNSGGCCRRLNEQMSRDVGRASCQGMSSWAVWSRWGSPHSEAADLQQHADPTQGSRLALIKPEVIFTQVVVPGTLTQTPNHRQKRWSGPFHPSGQTRTLKPEGRKPIQSPQNPLTFNPNQKCYNLCPEPY